MTEEGPKGWGARERKLYSIIKPILFRETAEEIYWN